jgi:ribosomal protein S14
MPDLEHYGSYGYGQMNCPRCGTGDVSWGDTMMTLVGWMGSEEQNPNHHTQGTNECRSCGLTFMREWVVADKNTWCAMDDVSGKRVVVAGYPTCCRANYTVRCSCGAWASNLQQGKTVRTVMKDGVPITEPPSLWQCEKCGYSSPEMPRPPEPYRRTAWEHLNDLTFPRSSAWTSTSA